MSWKKSKPNTKPLAEVLSGLVLLKTALEKERDETIKTAKIVMSALEKEVKNKKTK